MLGLFTLGFFEILFIALAAGTLLLIGFLAFIASRPGEFRIERSGQVNASPEVVFNIINNLRQWDRWSPWEKLDPNMKKTWEKLDPNMKKTVEGPPAGPSAVISWAGNSKAGEGRMTIIDSRANDYIAMKLEFFKPWVCTNQVRFGLQPNSQGTQVTWSMEGTNNFSAKLFSFLMNIDKMVGKDFEEGLANLNGIAQQESQKQK